MIYFFTGSNSSALSSNASSPTPSNGVGNQLAPTNVITGNSSSNPVALNSTHAPTTHKSTTRTVNSKEPVKTGTGSSAAITSMKDENSVSEKPESTTTPIVGGVSSPAKRSDDEGNVYSSRISKLITQRVAGNLAKMFKGKHEANPLWWGLMDISWCNSQ